MGNYHSGIDRISSSGLKLLLNKSPAHFHAKYTDVVPETPTRPKVLGSVVHAVILEGEDVAIKRYGVSDHNPGTKGYAAWLAENEGLEGGLKPDDWDVVRRMRDSLYSINDFRSLIEQKGVSEQAIEWTDPITGAKCKAKPDWLADDASLMIDLKTARDGSEWGFSRAVRSYQYDLSAALYVNGVDMVRGTTPGWLWVVVENDAPYAASIYEIRPDTMQQGESKVYQALDIYTKCLAEGLWPSYPRSAI
jgi:hypothetical protein